MQMTFARWIENEKLDAASLAVRTGFHRTYTWKVLTGRRQPSLTFIRRCIEISDGKLSANSFFDTTGPDEPAVT